MDGIFIRDGKEGLQDCTDEIFVVSLWRSFTSMPVSSWQVLIYKSVCLLYELDKTSLLISTDVLSFTRARVCSYLFSVSFRSNWCYNSNHIYLASYISTLFFAIA